MTAVHAPVVAVVGAGASGTLAAAHLAKRAHEDRAPLDIALIDPRPAGSGLAYSTCDSQHRLNVAAAKMSAWPDDPEHFLRWARRTMAADFPAGGFAPRSQYARYLAEVLADAVRTPYATSTLVHARAERLQPTGHRLWVVLAGGGELGVDAVVLATGYGRPDVRWASAELRAARQFVADPWAVPTHVEVRSGDDVLIVGAGLTAVDVARQWACEGARVHLVSRHGMLPLSHAGDAAPPLALDPERELPDTVAGARRLVFDLIRAANGDWRRVIDGLRPVTARWWCALSDDERRAFMRTASRRWDRVRHRVDPDVQEWLTRSQADGSLVLHTGEVLAAYGCGDRLRVGLSDGTVLAPVAVLNCTGGTVDARTSDDPLIRNSLAAGIARPGPLDLGLACDTTGRLTPSAGAPLPIWALGPLRRGELWETTAVPEIRQQAAALVDEIRRACAGSVTHAAAVPAA